MFCLLFQVGSSTWCMHFLTLANASKQVKEDYSQALQVELILMFITTVMLWLTISSPIVHCIFNTLFCTLQIAAVHLWPLPKFVGKFSALMKDMTSFMFVRNPWTRLVSVYFEKILGNPLGAWNGVNQEIISSQRNGKRSSYGKTPK